MSPLRRHRFELTVALVALVAVAAWHRELRQWFAPEHPPAAPGADAAGSGDETALIASAAALMKAQVAASEALARDDRAAACQAIAGLLAPAGAVAGSAAQGAESTVARTLAEALDEASTGCAGSASIDDLRARWDTVQRGLVWLGSRHATLQAGWSVFRCPMTDGFGRWIQPDPNRRNPYMGTEMLTCGSASAWDAEPASWEALRQQGDTAPDGVAWHTCPMHPSVHAQAPGQCPICGMDLIAVSRRAVASGEVRADEARRQAWGVRLEPAVVARLHPTLRVPVRLRLDAAGASVVSTRIGGVVRRAAPLTPGDPVEAGREVALIYSDTLEGLEREYLATRTADPDLAAPLRSRLLAGGLDEPGLRHIESTGRADGLVAARALAGGTVTRRLVRVGAVVAPGAPLLELSSTQAPWLEARIAEPDLAGLPAQLRGSARLFAWASPVAVELERLLPGTPETVAGGGAAGPAAGMGTAMEAAPPAAAGGGGVASAGAMLGGVSARLRLVEAPPAAAARIEGLAGVAELTWERSPAIVVPTTSVIRAGHRAVVFVAVSGDVFVPREVRLGVAAGERVEVAEGVGAGEVVVASGTFLVAAESRLQASDTFWRAGLPEGSGVTP